MRRLLLLLTCCVAFPCGAPRALAADGPTDTKVAVEVERCLKDLASDDYATRESARKRLQSLSREARPLLEARLDDPDPEVRRSVEALLAELGEPNAAPATVAEMGRLGLVTFRAEGSFTEVAEAWARVAGGTLRPPAGPTAASLRVAAEGVPYFEALAALLRPAGLDLADGFDEVGQAVLVARDAASAPPYACSGPFRLEVDSVTTTRSLRPGVRPRLSLLLRLLWSPEVQVTSFTTPEIVRAVDERGGTFTGTDGRGTTYGIGGGRRMAMLQVGLDPDEGTTGETLATLEAKGRIRVRHGRKSLEFRDLSNKDGWPRSVEADSGTGKGPVKAALESFGADPDRRGWVMGVLTVRLPRSVPPEGVAASLETSDGNLRPMLELSSRVASSDGVLRMTLRAAGVGPEVEPRTLHVTWYAQEDEVSVPFVLKGIPLR